MGDGAIVHWSVSECSSRDFKAGFTTTVRSSNQVWNLLLKEFESEGNVYCFFDLEVLREGTELQSFNSMISLINKIDGNRSIRIDRFVKYSQGKVKFSVPTLILLKDLLDPSVGFLMNDHLFFDTMVPSVPSPFQLPEFVDVSRVYVPHLQHVFNLQPRLLDSLRAKGSTHIFLVSALNALGSLLTCLHSVSMKDLDENVRNELKILWDGAEGYGLDLRWLKTHYEAALKAQDFVGSSNNIKRRKLDDGSFRELFAVVRKLEEGHYVRFVQALQASEAELANYGDIFNGKGEDDGIGYP